MNTYLLCHITSALEAKTIGLRLLNTRAKYRIYILQECSNLGLLVAAEQLFSWNITNTQLVTQLLLE